MNNNPINAIDPLGLKKIADYEKEIEKQEQRISDNERSKYNRYKKYKKERSGRKSQEENNRRNKFMDSLDDETKAKFDSVITEVDRLKGKIQDIEEHAESYNFYSVLTGNEKDVIDPRKIDDSGGDSDGGLYDALTDFNKTALAADVITFIASLGTAKLVIEGVEYVGRQGIKKYVAHKLKREAAKKSAQKYTKMSKAGHHYAKHVHAVFKKKVKSPFKVNFDKYGSLKDEFKSFEAYKKAALEFANTPSGGQVIQHTSKLGTIFKYDKVKGYFTTIGKEGNVQTFFRPKDGIKYFERTIKDSP